MANILADSSIEAQKVITAGIGSQASSSVYAATQITNLQPNQIANTGIGTALNIVSGQPIDQALGSAASSLTGVNFTSIFGSGGLDGTKPVPLHTERAGSEATDTNPYSFESDIEFFLLRADQSAPATSAKEEGDGEAAVPAETQTNSNFLGDALKTPLGQFATGLAVNAVLGGVQQAAGSNSLAVPLTGLALTTSLNAASGTGIFSQSAAEKAGGGASSVSQAVQTGPDAVTYGNAQVAQAQAANVPSPNTSSAAANLAKPNSGVDAEMATAAAAKGATLENAGETGGKPASPGAAAPQLNEDATSIQNKDTLADIPKSWYFITAPQDVSWSKEGKVASADTYGTNTPYVLYGSTSLRKLTLSNAMLEGFSDRKTVEANVVALETAMNMVIQKGYTAPFCWKVYAGGKSYGTFVISSVKVKEAMRDLRGYATRAFVDIELMQVPDYQVNSGRDLASKATLGGVSKPVQTLIEEQNRKENGRQGASGGAVQQDRAVASTNSGANPSANPGVPGGSNPGGIDYFNAPIQQSQTRP